MRRIILIAIVVALALAIACCLSQRHSEAPQVPCARPDAESPKSEDYLTNEKALAIYGDLLRRLELKTGEVVHPGFGDYSTDCCAVEYMESKLSMVLRVEGKAGIWIDAVTGKPYVIRNKVLSKRIEVSENPSSVEPTWTSEEAQRRSEALLEKIRGGLLKELHLQKVSFTKSGSYRSTWHLVWSTTYQGYDIRDGWMDVYLNEEFGLMLYRGGDIIPPTTTEVRIQKAEAVSRAEALHKQIAKEHAHFMERPVKGNLISADLVIVNPNYCYTRFQEGGKTVWGRNPTRHSRLAWVVRRRLPSIPGYTIEQATWIDAETGEVLGGELG